jgi:isocitrate dehydrogenase
MKLTDGTFHKMFDKVAAEYPEIENNHMIVDIGMAKLASNPYMFDVVVLPNLYGDVLSDVAAEITGSVGLAPSANIGDDFAMFEAIHGSAPDIAGQDLANPSGLLLAACNMLAHLGMGDKAEEIHNAWLVTIEEGIHTGDIFQAEKSTLKVGTQEFADHVIENLGKKPHSLPRPNYGKGAMPKIVVGRDRSKKKETIGVDVFLDWNASEGTPDELAAILKKASNDTLGITLITNRGVKVWPEGFPETYCTDHWRCRFYGSEKKPVKHSDVLDLLGRISEQGLDFIKTEHLCTFDGKIGYSLGQGE